MAVYVRIMDQSRNTSRHKLISERSSSTREVEKLKEEIHITNEILHESNSKSKSDRNK